MSSMNKWIERYNKKIPEGFKRDERFALFYSPEKGFAEIGDSGKIIIVNQVCGELKYWRDVAEHIARKRGRSHICTFCLRPILPYMRLAGVKVNETLPTKFGEAYFFEDKSTWQKGYAKPASDGSYFIVWEVTANGI